MPTGLSLMKLDDKLLISGTPLVAGVFPFSIEVIDVRSLRPLDRPTLIESVKKTSRCVVIEEDWFSYGVGAELVATIQEGAFGPPSTIRIDLKGKEHGYHREHGR